MTEARILALAIALATHGPHHPSPRRGLHPAPSPLVPPLAPTLTLKPTLTPTPTLLPSPSVVPPHLASCHLLTPTRTPTLTPTLTPNPDPNPDQRQVINFLETGNIVNSVNFPTAQLERQDASDCRLVRRRRAAPRRPTLLEGGDRGEGRGGREGRGTGWVVRCGGEAAETCRCSPHAAWPGQPIRPPTRLLIAHPSAPHSPGDR